MVDGDRGRLRQAGQKRAYPLAETEQIYKIIDWGREVCNHYAQQGGDPQRLVAYMDAQYFPAGYVDAAVPTVEAALSILCPNGQRQDWSGDGDFYN